MAEAKLYTDGAIRHTFGCTRKHVSLCTLISGYYR